MTTSPEVVAPRRRSRSSWPAARRWLARTVIVLVVLLSFYAAFLLFGFVPVNRGYTRPSPDERVRIFVRSNEIHTDLVLPVVHDELGVNWRRLFPIEHFGADVSRDRYVAIGWGNRRFFVETPRWADLKISAVIGALFWPSESVLHVEYLHDAAPGNYLREVHLTREQYVTLVDFIRTSVGSIDERQYAVPATTVTYHRFDRFYISSGRYHVFNTCNQWTGRGLKRAGVPVGIWTPLKPQVLCWLPDVDES
jgi:uncharacterized protein (TIGR02117 family)